MKQPTTASFLQAHELKRIIYEDQCNGTIIIITTASIPPNNQDNQLLHHRRRQTLHGRRRRHSHLSHNYVHHPFRHK